MACRINAGGKRTLLLNEGGFDMTFGQRVFQIHGATWFATNAFLFMIWLVSGAGFPWFLFPLFAWGIAVAIHATVVYGGAPELERGTSYGELD
jgi:hypothetical protein